jgi:hypothetical protein
MLWVPHWDIWVRSDLEPEIAEIPDFELNRSMADRDAVERREASGYHQWLDVDRHASFGRFRERTAG